MSFVVATPECFTAAAQDLARIGSAIRSANTAAAASTTQLAAAAQDEVSTAIAGVFGSVGQQYQTLLGQAEQFHDQFVQALTSTAGAYAATEAANASRLQTIEQHLGGDLRWAASIVKQYEEAYANLQTAFEAYENNPTEANLQALQLAITEDQQVVTVLDQLILSLAQILRQAGSGLA
jgi:hypothetical protein